VPPPALPKGPPALSPLDRRTRSRLTRGVVAIDRRIDLHGLTQAAAEVRLKRFLAEAQESGARVVLVITGKGAPEGSREERGVLRRVVPHWLAAADMRSIVVGFEEASRAHGGAGALYVRIRRRR
jgi:DNA-nicking Smr family endonuclease